VDSTSTAAPGTRWPCPMSCGSIHAPAPAAPVCCPAGCGPAPGRRSGCWRGSERGSASAPVYMSVRTRGMPPLGTGWQRETADEPQARRIRSMRHGRSVRFCQPGTPPGAAWPAALRRRRTAPGGNRQDILPAGERTSPAVTWSGYHTAR